MVALDVTVCISAKHSSGCPSPSLHLTAISPSIHRFHTLLGLFVCSSFRFYSRIWTSQAEDQEGSDSMFSLHPTSSTWCSCSPLKLIHLHPIQGMCSVPRGSQGQVGWGPGQPDLVLDLVVGNPAHSSGVGISWSLRSLPIQAILWFCAEATCNMEFLGGEKPILPHCMGLIDTCERLPSDYGDVVTRSGESWWLDSTSFTVEWHSQNKQQESHWSLSRVML